MGLAKRLEEEIAGDMRESTDHAFYRGLADGTLPESVWVRYLEDDARFVVDLAKLLAELAARAPNDGFVAPLNRLADGLRFVARGQLGEVLKRHGSSIEQALSRSHHPATEVYIRTVRSFVNEGTFAEGLAGPLAILVHHRFTGREYRARQELPATEYGDFLRHFGASPIFLGVLAELEAGLDALAVALSPAELAAVRRAYRTCSRLDRMHADTHVAPKERSEPFPDAIFDGATAVTPPV